MKFLITGGAGFIGSHIAAELMRSEQGEVVVFDNLSVGTQQNIPDRCRFFLGDIRDKGKLYEAMCGVDIVFHDAAFVSIRGSFERLREELDINCTGTLNVLEVAAEHRVKKIVFASSMAVYGEPKYLPVDETHPLFVLSPYGLSKIRGEMYCRIFAEKHGLDSVILRYFNTYGIKQTPSPYVGVITTFINQAIKNEPLTIFGDGKQTRDFVWVEDIARANILAALSDESGIFNIASGNETSIEQIADMIIGCVGGSKEYLPEPAGEIKRIYADISRARKLLNYQPEGEVLRMLPHLIDWWHKK